jgi:hypothetical protein
MAVYIELLKVSETANEAIYDYYPEGDRSAAGRLLIEKTTDEIKELLSSPIDNVRFFSSRGARKLLMYHEREEYPEKTCWAS